MTSRRGRGTRYTILAAGAVAILGGCTGATVGSGVGEARLERPPFYTGRTTGDIARIAYTPVAYQPGAAQSPIFDPEAGEGTAVQRLLHEMNAYLDSVAPEYLVAQVEPPSGSPPDVHFGCETDGMDECLPQSGSGFFGPGDRPLRLAIGRPSASWTEGAAAAIGSANADALLMLTLEVGQYWPRQANWRGSKEVELGTGHAASLPWLTSLDDPVQVLQLTGALLGPDGKAIRIGAEGLRARRTNLILSGLGAQELISEGDVEVLMSERRQDLRGQPLVWQAAIDALLTELTGR